MGPLRQGLFLAFFFLSAILLWLVVIDAGLLKQVPGVAGLSDWLLHALAFFGVGLIAFFLWPAVQTTAVWLFAAGVGVEVIQLALPGRTSTLIDAFANLGGIILAALVFLLIRHFLPSPMSRPAKANEPGNIDLRTVSSFGEEWSRFDQADLSLAELEAIFAGYFALFPWHDLPAQAKGFDMGCGSGRWAAMVAPRVGHLTCIDASHEALAAAGRNLSALANVTLVQASLDKVPLAHGSQDFGYSLGVLHHVPDTRAALKSCVNLLRSGAPFLLYLYYRFDNRPLWFRLLWRISNVLRQGISRMPDPLKSCLTDIVAALIYWPLAKLAHLSARFGLPVRHLPLSFYRDKSFYTMRTDSRDRFGTPLEQRFSKSEIVDMMLQVGLEQITVSNEEPFWCALGIKR